MKLELLAKLTDSKSANDLFLKLQTDHDTHLPLYLAQLKRLVDKVGMRVVSVKLLFYF
jgi:hypothetical protein